MSETADRPDAGVRFELFTSSFCGACRRTRSVLHDAARYVPGATFAEHPVESEPELAEATGITATPTVIIRNDAGTEVFRATGVPTLPQVLVAAARALGPEAASGSAAPGQQTNPLSAPAGRPC